MKLKAIIRWFMIVFFIGVFGFCTEWLMFHFAWITRDKFIGKLFWIWLDDNRHTGEDYRIWLQSRGAVEETWWLSYKWHLRNKVWNLNNLFKVADPYKYPWSIKEYVIDDLNRNYEHVDQSQKWVQIAGLKFIPKHKENDIWQVNEGDIISEYTSIIGTGYIWYVVNNWTSFRYSQCEIVNYGFWKGWRTIKLGTNSKRYIFTIKHQAIKPWQ